MQTSRGKGTDSSLLDRLIAAVNYISFGLVGFIYLIVNAIRGGRMSAFLQYHIFQSFFLVMLYWLFGVFVDLITRVLYFIPIVKNLIPYILLPFNVPIVNGFSIVSGTVALIIFYLVLTSIQGMYSYIPWVSDIIKGNVRG